MQIQLYHLSCSRSQRIVWLLEELNLPYELIICNQENTHEAPDNLKTIHPLGKVPILTFKNNTNTPIILAESASICQFLSRHFQQFDIDCTSLRTQADFDYWLHFSESTFLSNLVLKQVLYQMKCKTPFPVRFITHFIKQGLDYGFLNHTLHDYFKMTNQHLATQPYFAGQNLSIVDILMWFPLLACSHAHVDFQRYSHVQHYLQQIENRPAFQRACIKGEWSTAQFQHYWQRAWN